MSRQTDSGIADILKKPEVKTLVDHVNPETTARQKVIPKQCGAFSKQYSVLTEDRSFRFKIHPEAARRLPKIADNTAQKITGMDSGDAPTQEFYQKKRHIGIVFSGGPAPGGHNVIAGLFDAAKRANPQTKIFGFLMGPEGVIENETVEITAELVDAYRNLGGFNMIKTGRAKIDTAQKVALSKETCKALGLDALVVVGGDDSNTNAAFLAQEMHADGIQVIGVPKTIDGDIQVKDDNGKVLCAISFGFHTAARAFANEVANLCTDCGSDTKYWHICKVMGRVASHLALEVALQTHANMTLIGEDLADYVDTDRLAQADSDQVDYNAYGMTLRHLSRVICDAVVRRAAVGKSYGVLVIPEGVLEFINEIQVFIIKLNTIIANYNSTYDTDFHSTFPTLDEKLDYLRRLVRRGRETGDLLLWSTRDDDLFNDIPDFFQEGLLTERDAHGNFQFSLVQTDKVLLGLVNDYLEELKQKGQYRIGIKKDYFKKMLQKEGLDPGRFGPLLFKNYDAGLFLLRKEVIISQKTLQQILASAGALGPDGSIPAIIEKIYKQSIPKFKTQSHFYGYDGRGNDPTLFDCTYTYNLGLTVFSLVANGATGQMAAIRKLEQDFEQWEPMGIPIVPLMHLEERKGKLSLVMEKSLVDVNKTAFKVVKALRETWLAAVPGDDSYRRPSPITLWGEGADERPLTLVLNALD